jgi:hypothetical protein
VGIVAAFGLFIALYLNPANHPHNRFGWWNVLLMERADRTEVYRYVEGKSGKTRMVQVGGPIVPSKEWVSRMKSALLNTKNFDWDAIIQCIPMPGVMVRMHTGGRHVDFHLCFECHMVWTEGSTRHASMDHSRDELASLVKEIFPNDAGIQAIRMSGM